MPELAILALVALACVGWTLALMRRNRPAPSEDVERNSFPAVVGTRSDGCVTLDIGDLGWWMNRHQADWLGLQLMLAAHATAPNAPSPETSTARHDGA